jgi:post-segregation antitoxin (ccd killing protein)|tara:strand:+ start:2672 stop:2860 length:189 start_codon:yes stop_codon:yes gene_type:complete
MLNVFEEYDRTRKLRRINYKTRVNFTVDEDLFNKFRSYCKRNGLNMSAKIESYMKKELEKKK